MTPRPEGLNPGWKQARTENRTPPRALTPEAAPSVLAHKAARVILAPLTSLGLRAVGYKTTDEPADRFRAAGSSRPGFPAPRRERQEHRDGRPSSRSLFIALYLLAFLAPHSVPRVFPTALSVFLSPLLCISFPPWYLPHGPLPPCQGLR